MTKYFLDEVNSLLYLQVILPDNTLARSFFVATSVSLVPGYEEVTIFGGGSKFRAGISIHEISKLANTTLLIFGKNNQFIPVVTNTAI